MKKIRYTLAALLTLNMYASVANAESYAIDQSHSKVGFTVTHMMISEVDGTFSDYQGSIELDGTDLLTLKSSGTIKVASISTDNEKRDKHLRSPDFFDAEKYPEIKFVTTGVKKEKSGYVATGKLTMRGVTKDVRLPLTLKGPIKGPWGNTRIGLKAEIVIDRQDFGVSWSKTLDAGGLVVSDEVTIELVIEAIQNK